MHQHAKKRCEVKLLFVHLFHCGGNVLLSARNQVVFPDPVCLTVVVVLGTFEDKVLYKEERP